MFEAQALLWLVPGLPLAAAILVGLLGPRILKHQSHVPVIAAFGGSCAVALLILAGLLAVDTEPILRSDGGTWFSSSLLPGRTALPPTDLTVSFSVEADTLTATMLVAITFVGTFIAIFSAGYMKGDAGYPRFFAVMSLFLFSMTGLVLANNFLLLYAFWEGVGLCSYLLIGFWFERPSAAAAARKAFLVTRLGDAGMILGIMLLWSYFGHRLDYDTVFRAAKQAGDSPEVTLACLLLFCGAVGKSAQFPLHVWLPDAMEGPTPVSALIHAATMVTAGVYLVARCTPLFILSPAAQLVVSGIGGITALLAALIALTQNDLKRVLAYSTVSQLGYMFMALGAGLREHKLAVFAVSAAIFHLFTHAFFKALLFLGSGSVMHAMGNVIDIRRFGGLRKVLPLTHVTFAGGALALAGVIPFAGFWSKDEILEALLHAGEHSDPYKTVYLALFAVALITAGLTAFYTFRAYFKTFWGELHLPEEALHHGHGHNGSEHGAPPAPAHGEPPRTFESPPLMTVPLIVLAFGSLLVGVALGPTGLMARFLAQSSAFQPFQLEPMYFGPGFDVYVHDQYLRPAPYHWNWMLIAISTLTAAAGIAVAYLMYVAKPDVPGKLASSARWAYNLSLNKFRFDEIYAAIIVHPLAVVAVISRFFDLIVDGLVDLAGLLPRLAARIIQPVQNGLVQFYALFMMVFLTALMAILVLWIRQ